MRALLFLFPLVAAASVSAQEAPTDTSARPATVSTPRTARLALPTSGGVFYYRAGAGRGVRPALSRTSSPPPRVPAATGSRETEPNRPVAVASGVALAPIDTLPGVALRTEGVTQRDLDRLEDRILAALDRRLDDFDRQRPTDLPRRTEPAIIVPVVPQASGERPAEQTADRPTEPYREVPISDLPPARPVPTPEAGPPTVEQVERDILDTGLFRTTYVHFAFAKSDLLPISQQTLDAVATVLRRYPDLRIEIGGHTDAVGSDETNDRLSGERAGAVAAYLVASGVAPARLRAAGYGERLPVATNDTETGRALNRRVEFVVLNPEAGQRLR